MIYITVLTLAFGVGLLLGVDAVGGQVGPTVPVVAVVAHSLSKMLFVDVRAAVNPTRLSPGLAFAHAFLAFLFFFFFFRLSRLTFDSLGPRFLRLCFLFFFCLFHKLDRYSFW